MRAAVFAMADANHFRRVGSVAAALAAAGAEVRVWTDAKFAASVAAAGAQFADVFEHVAVADADATSRPLPIRYVTWTAAVAEPLVADVAAFDPDVVVYGTFAMAGRLVAERLGVPSVAVLAGHARDPATAIPDMRATITPTLDPACEEAVEHLRERYGWDDASPFMYLGSLSRHLNLACEPPAYLTAQERRPLEPVAFWGTLAAVAPCEPAAPRVVRRAYAALGTIVWRYWPDEALALLDTVARALTRRRVEVVVGLGGADVDAGALRRPGVRVERWADQDAELRAADVLVTHHGMNSTHEALAAGVPMLSAPFFADQPALAARCAELGVAEPLGSGRPREPVGEAAVDAALDRLLADPPARDAALRLAYEREREVIARRPEVVAQIIELARARTARPRS